MKTIDELRETADECTTMAGVENKFETVWITKKPFMKMLDAIERELEEEYVALPKDADGVPIHIGDMLDCGEVCRIEIADDGDHCAYVKIPMLPILERNLCSLSHHKPSTVEDVLREFALKCEDAGYAGPKVETIASEFAERLQLRGEHDG